MLPVTLTVVPVRVVALTLAPPKMLPPVMLPVTLSVVAIATIPVPEGVKLILPLVAVLCNSRLPVVSTSTPVIITLPPFMLPVTLTLVPVAAPMSGVVSCALALTTILPVPSNAVLMLSVFALNTVPFSTRPAEVLAENVPAPENWVNTIGLVPKVGLSVVCTQPVSASVAPEVTNKKSPPAASAEVSKSVLLVNKLLLV